MTLATSEHEQEQKTTAKTPLVNPTPGDALAPEASHSLGISMCLAEMIRIGRARKQAMFPRICDPGKEFHCGNMKKHDINCCSWDHSKHHFDRIIELLKLSLPLTK